MSIRNLSIDSPYGEDIQGTVAEIETFYFTQDPCHQQGKVLVRWRVYNSVADAVEGCKPVVMDEIEEGGNSFTVMTVVGIPFDTLRDILYDWIMTRPEYAGGTKVFEVMP